MSSDAAQWSKLYDYLDKRFADIDNRFESIETGFNARFNRIDATLLDIFARFDDLEVEQAAINMQLVRHDGWINQLATKTSTKLKEA